MGFEPTIPANEPLQIYALDSVATGIGQILNSRVSIAIMAPYVVASKVTVQPLISISDGQSIYECYL
jgi:hypothetical protein